FPPARTATPGRHSSCRKKDSPRRSSYPSVHSLLALSGGWYFVAVAGREPRAVGTDATGSRTNKWTLIPMAGASVNCKYAGKGCSATRRDRDGAFLGARCRRLAASRSKEGRHLVMDTVEERRAVFPRLACDRRPEQHVAAAAKIVRHTRDPAPE